MSIFAKRKTCPEQAENFEKLLMGAEHDAMYAACRKLERKKARKRRKIKKKNPGIRMEFRDSCLW